jgi:hypothetical protein
MEHQKEQDVLNLKNIFKELLRNFYIPDVAKFIEDLEDPLEGASLEQMFELTKKLKASVESQKTKIQEKSRWKAKNLDKFMDNQDNFSRSEWKSLETFKNKLEDYKKDFQIAAQGAGIRQIVKEGRERASRKKNNLEKLDSNQKKKNWIPM